MNTITTRSVVILASTDGQGRTPSADAYTHEELTFFFTVSWFNDNVNTKTETTERFLISGGSL